MKKSVLLLPLLLLALGSCNDNKIISVENFENVHIYNTSGKLILVSYNEQINVSDFVPGLYIAKIFTAGKTFNLRFVKI